ncbi:MAG TPA: glycosyltransferase, partial [Phycisphaerae bacterium]|nr:glycosyltransferase [Phycisphaerae bacterium]
MGNPANGKIRICEIITSLEHSGAEKVVCDLATRLDTRRFDVEVVGIKGGELADWLENHGVRVHVLNIGAKREFYRVDKFLRLMHILRKGCFDIIHSHLFHADLLGRLAKPADAKYVYTIHVAEHRARPLQFQFARKFQRRCDALVAVSNAVLEHHSKMSHLPPENYRVIYNGVDTQEFRFDGTARRELRARWGIAPDVTLFAFIGRFHREKGLDILFDAMRLANIMGRQIRVVLAGDGPLRNMVQNFMTSETIGENVINLGFRDDIPAILSAADVLVAPSRWEGFCLSIAEAMSVSLPVIATKCGGPEELVVDGQTGLLVERENRPMLAQAMIKLAD